MTKEEQFFNTLENLFIGAPVEGESGYINLMRIKARYFGRVMMPRLREEIAQALQPFPLLSMSRGWLLPPPYSCPPIPR